MKILVTGGTGTVGSEVVRQLLSRGAEISVLTRRTDARLPQGVRAVRGDLDDVATIRSAFEGFDGIFLLNAVGPSETNEGIMGVNGARMGGVKRLVYLSVHKVDEAPHLPHFASKLAVEAAVKASGIQWTILRPNNFYQNDNWFKDVIAKNGVYPQPIGDVGLSRVDVRDIAEAAAVALVEGKQAGQTYNLVGPEALTGGRTAQVWSSALGRAVAYGGDDMDAWERQALQMLPPLIAFDFRLMYEFFQKQGLKATPADVERLTALLGHAPRQFEDFVKEMVREM